MRSFEMRPVTPARALTEAERTLLEFMLSPDDTRLEPLRAQASTAAVSESCSCGCATIGFVVDRRGTSRAGLPSTVLAQSAADPALHPGRPLEVLLFVRDGWLESLEVVYYEGEPPREFPSIDVLTVPQLRS